MEEQEPEASTKAECCEMIRDTVEALVQEGYTLEEAVIAVVKRRYCNGMDFSS